MAAPPRRLARQFDAWGRRSAIGVDPALALRAVTIWSRLHGLVGLEIGGNFASMGLDAGQLFEAELSLFVARAPGGVGPEWYGGSTRGRSVPERTAPWHNEPIPLR